MAFRPKQHYKKKSNIESKPHHKIIRLKYADRKIETVRLGKNATAQQKLQALHKRIEKFDVKQYTLSMDEISFGMNDINAFTNLLESCKTKIVLQVTPFIEKRTNHTKQTRNCFNLKVKYKKKQKIFPFPLDSNLWTDHMLFALRKDTRNHFKIKQKVILCEDSDGEIPFDAIDDLKTAFDEIDEDIKDKRITFSIYAIPDLLNTEDEKEQKEKPKVIKDKLIIECVSNHMDKILNLHEITSKKILNDTQCFISKKEIESELFKNCIDCLYKVRPKSTSNQAMTHAMRQKMAFWQKYAYLCLIIQNIRSCIQLRSAVLSELYEIQNDFFSDHFEVAYLKLMGIIHEYHAMKENDADLLFDKLWNSCTDIKVMVPTEMMPTDDSSDNIPNKQNITTMDEDHKQQPHENSVRIYLLSPYPSHKTYVILPEISAEYCEMRAISRQHPHLLYVDLYHIQWNDAYDTSTALHFKCQTRAGFVTIKPTQRIRKEDHSFYWVEDKRSGMQKAWNYFTSFMSITQDMKSQAAQWIIDQLLAEIIDYRSFVKCSGILLHLKTQIHLKNMDAIYKELATNIGQRHKMMDVFKMQTMNILTTRILDTKAVYDIIKTCFSDQRSPFKAKATRCTALKHEIGNRIYDDFIHCVRKLFQKHNIRNVSTAQYLMLHPIYHFFRYFEQRKERNQRHRNRRYYNRNNNYLEFHEQNNNFLSKDLLWQSIDVMDIMSLDLNIAISLNNKREHPLEFIAVRLAQMQDKNKLQFVKNILVALSAGNRADCEALYSDLFRKCSSKIFDIMTDNFQFWTEIITLMKNINKDLITSNKPILNAFQRELQKQMDRMTLNRNKLPQIHSLMARYPQIFDTRHIRLSILRNKQLITNNGYNINVQKLKKNIDYILKITLNKIHMSKYQTIRSELVPFIAHILRNKNIKYTAFSVIGAHFLQPNDPKLFKIFQTAMKEIISQIRNIAERLSIFMEVEQFYQSPFVNMHRYFMDLVLADSHNTNIHSWDAHQIQTIQQLITKYAKPPNESAIKLWNQILQQLIILPEALEPVPMDTFDEEELDEFALNYTDSENEDEKKGVTDDEEEEDDDLEVIADMKVTIEHKQHKQHKQHVNDMDLMHRLRYCFSMRNWLQFAWKNRFNIKPFEALIDFTIEQLHALNQRIVSKQITIECLQLIEDNYIMSIVKYCAYETQFDHKVFTSMIEQLADWERLSQQFRTFLNKFTKPGDAIEAETKTFLQILKDWDTEQYIDIEAREEWMKWLFSNAKTLFFLCDYTESHVFSYIWWSNRDKAGDEQAIDLQHYMGVIYVNSELEFAHLKQRALDLKLTFEDKVYFQDVDLIQELNIMQLPKNVVQKIEKDMADSLKLDQYVDFVQYLVEIVGVFIDYGHTDIRNADDEEWKRLNENLNTAKFRKNDKNQNISEAAKLYRDISAAVNQKYDNLTKQWIRTVVKCKETVNKLRNEEQYEVNRFSDTLKLIDDFSTDGQMIQLSGSLRSIYQQFTNIWQQTFRTKIHLMQHFAAIRIKRNDINNILDVHENESKIKQIVSDAEKMAQQRAMETLEHAMTTGYFEFAEQTNIEQSIKDLHEYEFEIDAIGAKCLNLCFIADNKQQQMGCDEIQSRINIILLCRRNNDMHKEDEKEREEKKESLEEHNKENVNEYIRKFEICKEISESRVQFIVNGGRMDVANEDAHDQQQPPVIQERLHAKQTFDYFINKQNEWRQRLFDWNDYVFNFRNDSHLLCYFTINKIRVIIQQLNEYKQTLKMKHKVMKQKENKEELKHEWSCSACTVLNEAHLMQCHVCLGPNPFVKHCDIQRADDDMKAYLFEQLLSHFRFINPNLSERKFKKRLEAWHSVNANVDNALKSFDRFFDNDDILNLNVIESGKQHKNVNLNVITNGVPNLMVTKSEKDALFATLKLYHNMNQIHIPPNQILICDKSTTSEHIQIFIFRCLQNEQRFQYEESSSAPLFCLLFPEYLMFSVMDKSVEIINKYLLSKNQKTKRYSLVVISCTNKRNPICDILRQYKTNDISSTFTANNAKHICDELFNGHKDKQIWEENRLFVQIYNSAAVGAGKSFVIQQNAEHKNANGENSLIRIPINSPDIDLNFIICGLYRCYDAKQKHTNKKIIYHLDISSSASTAVNILLFNLLFLRYIATAKHECFAVSTNMAFCIELPTKLASLINKDHTIQDEFYLLHDPIQISKRHINMDTNPFQYDDHCHFAVKFLQHFYADELKTKDPNPTDQKMDEYEMRLLIDKKFSNAICRSPIHQKSMMEYLFTQFEQVVHSTQLQNEWRRDQGQGFNHWKHLVTDSIIDLAEDFCSKLYDDDAKYGDTEDESTGTEHFHLTQKWQKQVKPIVLLNQSVDGSISFLVSDKTKMDQVLLQTSKLLRFDILDWKQQDQIQSKEEKIALLLTILGTYSEDLLIQLSIEPPYCDYALTFDNMLKMIAIFFRIKANIPVILMGETGCGKTALLSYLAKAANRDIERADIHGGFTYKHIKHKMEEWISIAKQKTKASDDMLELQLAIQCGEMPENEQKEYRMYQIRKEHEMKKTDDMYVFFDEVNTSPDVGYFKEILCDAHFDGKSLPKNMKIIAACNPYRKRTIKRTSIINDPLSEYMYRVYPLPSSMKEYIWMFGSLSEKDERAYTFQMCQTFTDQILRKNAKLQTKLSKLIVVSQAFVRKKLKDSAFVSLRDIARCLKIFKYAFTRSNDFHESMIEALALVYYFRLKDKDRYLYNKQLSNHNVHGFYSTLEGKNGIIDKICHLFENVIPAGIALNRSLRENLFLLFICIQTKTPLILVGKPGSSKTLAMRIIQDYMADKAGKEAQKLKDNHLKPIHVISFQCSTQSKADGICERWKQTQKFAQDNKDIISVLLLDEIGLAEHSAHRPLKVLHQLLEIDPAPIAFVGLSNWSLDAAKMNRAIMHLCPRHKIEDLTQTATAMAQQYVIAKRINKIKTKLKVLSYVYKDITAKNNKLQPRLDFFGARDFYAVVKHFLIASSRNRGFRKNDDEELIMYFLRNFGGINYQNDEHNYNELRRILFNIIEKHMPLKEKHLLEDTVNQYPPVRLVELNLNDRRSTHHFDDAMVVDNFMISRHMMVITQYVNSWNVLLDLNIINYQNIFIFGSEFERDKTNNIYLHLNRVKQCMETGQTLILCNLHEINESLYDMLNQRYTFIKNSGKMYCRIALGSNSQTCFVDREFKCIVISTKDGAHRNNGGVPIAFLNRFEKQLISYHSSLSPKNLRFLYKLRAEICELYFLNHMRGFKQIFPGFCRDTFPSLIMNVMQNDDDYHQDDEKINHQREQPKLARDDAMRISCDMLFGVTLTEALIQTTVNHKNTDRRKPLVEYIPSLQSLIDHHTAFNKLLIVLTFDFENKLNTNMKYFEDTHVAKMSQFSRAEQFEQFFVGFLRDHNVQNNTLLLQYRHTNMNHFIHMKHMMESRMPNKENKKRVVLLVHLHRNEDLYKEFPLIFCKTSRIVFLDSLSQKDPIPLDSFTNHSILDVCRERGIALLQATFQRALSHLEFDTKMDIKHEIQTLSHLLSDDTKHVAIQKLIWDRFLMLLSDNTINRNIGDIVCKSISNHKSWQRGSFYERLHDIIDTVSVLAMIRILRTLYTHFNLNILLISDSIFYEDVIHLFVELYSQFDLIEDKVLDVNIENILEVRPNQLFVKTDFIAQFPFSHLIHAWCNSVKSRVTNVDIKEDESDDDDDDDDYVMMDLDSDMEIDVDPSARLKQEMISIWPQSLCNMSMDIASFYVHDLIQLNARKLQITAFCTPELIDLGAKLFMLIGFHFEFILYDHKISIAELETILWNKSDFLQHILSILKVLKKHQLMNIFNMMEDKLINATDLLLENVLKSLDHEMYPKFHLYSIPQSIQFIINELSTKQFVRHNNNGINDLYAKFNMIKIKMITFKCDLLPINDDLLPLLYEIMDSNNDYAFDEPHMNKTDTMPSFMDYNVLRDSFQLLTDQITDESKERAYNEILYELLSLVQLSDHDMKQQIEQYATFLVNALCKMDIAKDIASIQWSQETEDEIVRRIFAVLSRDDLQSISKKILNQIQNENEELAGKIIQVQERTKDHELKQDVLNGEVEYAIATHDFDKELSLKIPLSKQLNDAMYEQCMEAVETHKFLRFHRFNSKQFPVLSKLKRQQPKFWHLYKLPPISEWIQQIQTKYMGSISENGCNKLNMIDVWEHCKLNKWGDINEWKQTFKAYRSAMNAISINNHNLPPTDHNTSISSSLIDKHINQMTKNNLQCIQHMFELQNKFLTEHLTKDCNFFDLRHDQLINIPKILEVIKANAKPWICYDAKNELASKTYLVFNVKRIENEIKEQCINGRHRLRIKYRYFECIGSKNMLRLIQSIGIQQDILNYEVWHLFDKQFESNTQRKKALNTIEDVLRLISNAKLENDDDFDEFADAKEDQKHQDNANTHHHMAINNQNQAFWQFIQHSLQFDPVKCEIFKVSHAQKTIQLKHIQSLWNELVKRIDGERSQYQDQCYCCYYSVVEQTPIELECCELNLHYECLKDWIKHGFGKKGTRIYLKQLSCLMCKQPMRHKAANELFKDTRILYEKVQQVALDQLREENKTNDPAIVNKDGAFYNNPTGYAMKLYAIWLCFECGNPYYYGAGGCAIDGIENVREDQFLCVPCYDAKEKARMERLRRENAQLYAQYIANQGIKPCPGGCGHGLIKISGCNFIQCGACKTGVCWQTGLRAGKGAGMCGGGHACHF